MKNRKIFILIIAISIATISAFNVSIKTNENGQSNVSLDNIEALAQETDVPDCVPAKGFCCINGVNIDQIAIE